MMDEKTRIQKDIDLFKLNLKELDKNNLKINTKVVELATQYYNDSIYYLNKNDFFTAFGCINYGHGLLDAIIKF
jgi:hypothetical protein